jgi:hypothetical protein
MDNGPAQAWPFFMEMPRNFMTRFCNFVGCTILLIATIPCVFAQTSLETRRAQLKAAMDEEWQYELKVSPELATQSGDSRYNDQLTDYSAKSFADQVTHAGQMLRVSNQSIRPASRTRKN